MPPPTCRGTPVDGWTCSTGTAPTEPTSAARHVTSASPGRPCTAGSSASTASASKPSRTAAPLRAADDARPGRLAELGAVRSLRQRYPRWGKDKLVVLLRRLGIDLSISMVGRILTRLLRTGELREPRWRRRVSVPSGAGSGHRPSAGRPPGRSTVRRPGRARHPRHPAAAGQDLEAVHGPRRGQPLGHGRARSAGDGGIRGRGARSPSPSGCRSRSGPSASTTAPSSWPSSRRPARRGASGCSSCRPLTQAPRRGRARQPDPHRGVLRGHHCRTRARGVPGRAPGLGDDVQPGPAPPGPGLPDPGRVPGLRRHRCVTDVLDEYTRLTLPTPAA